MTMTRPPSTLGLAALPTEELQGMINELEREMNKAAQALEFEKAAALRDQIFDLRGALAARAGSRRRSHC